MSEQEKRPLGVPRWFCLTCKNWSFELNGHWGHDLVARDAKGQVSLAEKVLSEHRRGQDQRGAGP